MSADNWVVCPRCAKKADDDFKIQYSKKYESYGKVSLEEYEAMTPVEKPVIDTDFREDYELGVTDGVFEVSYRGKCTTCGLTYSFKHRENVM